MEFVPAVAAGVVLGTLARLHMLRSDYRLYPSYPQGYAIHLSLGFVAAFLGAVAVPAVVTGDFAAASFLALAATQFREVRTVERETLANTEITELVPRGAAYIEGIARAFEARNYLAMVTALVTSLAAVLFRESGLSVSLLIATAAGLAILLIQRRAMRGRRIEDIARVRSVPLSFEGPLLVVADVHIMNVGLPEAREKYLQDGLAVIIEPLGPEGDAVLSNLGQRQAIAHDVTSLLGLEKDVDEPEFTPVPRRNPATGAMVLAFIPAARDEQALVTAVGRVPVLEGTVRQPLEAEAGRAARRG